MVKFKLEKTKKKKETDQISLEEVEEKYGIPPDDEIDDSITEKAENQTEDNGDLFGELPSESEIQQIYIELHTNKTPTYERGGTIREYAHYKKWKEKYIAEFERHHEVFDKGDKDEDYYTMKEKLDKESETGKIDVDKILMGESKETIDKRETVMDKISKHRKNNIKEVIANLRKEDIFSDDIFFKLKEESIRGVLEKATNFDPNENRMIMYVLAGEVEWLYNFMSRRMEFASKPTKMELVVLKAIKEMLGK